MHLGRFGSGRTWNRLAQRNPYGAILTGEEGTIAAWDREAFFATGRADVERFLATLNRIAPDVPRSCALDFGCGVGRMTRPLADHFDRVVGVDVAPVMIERARVIHAECRNCAFVINRAAELRAFGTGTFDVVYSRLVLQHLPPSLVRAYLPELIRVLSPRGILTFQLPERMDSPLKRYLEAPVQGGRPKQVLPRVLIRAYRLVKYAWLAMTSGPRMSMYGLPADEVCRIIDSSGGTVVTALPDTSHGVAGVGGFEYWVTKARHQSGVQ